MAVAEDLTVTVNETVTVTVKENNLTPTDTRAYIHTEHTEKRLTMIAT